MKKRRKSKTAGFMRYVLAANIRRLMDAHFTESRNRPKSLAEAAGVSLSQVQRILKPDLGTSIDHIEAIAAVFQLSSYQLLIPDLTVGNEQVVHGATKSEERLYRQWKKLGTAVDAVTEDAKAISPLRSSPARAE